MLGFFRLGFIDVVLSRALLRGFITGVAVVILLFVSIALSLFVILLQTILDLMNPHMYQRTTYPHARPDGS